jgi:hypothetical protein
MAETATGKVHVLELFTKLERQRYEQLQMTMYWAERWLLMGMFHLAQEAKEEAARLQLDLSFLRTELARLKVH